MWWSGCDLRRAQLVDAAPWGSHSCAAAALRRREEAGAALVRDDLAAGSLCAALLAVVRELVVRCEYDRSTRCDRCACWTGVPCGIFLLYLPNDMPVNTHGWQVR